jgi:hypothetical protein
MKQVLLLVSIFYACQVSAQGINPALNKDSLFEALSKNLPEPKLSGMRKMYKEGGDEEKELILILLAVPESSKKQLMDNIDSNYANVNALRLGYAKLVPKNYIVNIEFKAANKITDTPEMIDLIIDNNDEGRTPVDQERDMEYNAPRLADMLRTLHWNQETLKKIRQLLAAAHCISIKNDSITTIGFARSGMGKYSYKLFDHDLASDEVPRYNNDCFYIYYKKNIVLEYKGGAIGSHCFPDKKD